MSTNPIGTNPVVDPQLAADIAGWEQAMAEWNAVRKDIQQKAGGIKTLEEAMLLLGLMMSPDQDQLKSQSDLLNIDTDMRNDINSGQSSYNTIANGDKNAIADANDMVAVFNQLEAGLKLALSSGAIDQDTYNSGIKEIEQVKTAFGTSWGNGAKMVQDVDNWTNQASGIPVLTPLPPAGSPLLPLRPAVPNKGGYSPKLTNIQNGFQSLIQVTSALSQTTNTQIQYLGQQINQIMGSFESCIQSLLKTRSAMIQNQKTS